jgi:tRNA nucleotidyltransferase (CCA-adding enzyme)
MSGDNLNIPKNVITILEILEKNGYEGYAVGGCVRDTVLGREPEDWDITTSASPEQVKSLFHRTIDTGISHGTVTVMIGTDGYELTTYRMDGEYEDHRHPREVQFTPDLTEDLKRRDFTMNAMAYNPKTGIVDKFDGMDDMKRKCIRCVGNAAERFEEDALRMLRGIRFAGQLQFVIEEDTLEAIRDKAPTIVNVSAERIRTELTKLLVSDGADRLLLARETGLSAYILPELDEMLDTEQNNPHHRYDVGHHVMAAVQEINRLWKENPSGGEKAHVWLVYAALLHDVAKPDCRTSDEEHIDHFYNHAALGMEKARAVLHRLKFDNETVSVVTRLIEHHDSRHENCFIEGAYSEKGKYAMRRLMNRMGAELMPYLFLLQEADLLAQSSYKQEEKLQKLAAARRCYREICEAEDAVTVKELAVDGRDLIALGMKPGPAIGEILKKLLEAVMEDPSKNKKERLLALAREEKC